MPTSRDFSRRQLLQTTGAIAGGVAAAAMLGRAGRGAAPAGGGGAGFTVSIYHDPKDAIAAAGPVQWAIGHLEAALKTRGATVLRTTDKPGGGDFSINLNEPQHSIDIRFNLLPEGFLLSPPGEGDASRGLAIRARDSAGLVYALTELADRVTLSPGMPGPTLAQAAALNENGTPATPYRGIVRLFMCETEDKRWFYDRAGWQKYFDMLVTHRFNRFNLSFGLSYDFSTNLTDTYTFFMYPFFLDVPGYKVRAIAKGGTPLPAEEQQKNLETLKYIGEQAALRGLKFTVGIWTHNYKWTTSPNATYTIDGLDAQTQAPYSRDAMKMLLDACPGITGLTLRTHGESGVPEGSYDIWKVIMSGMVGHKNADGTPRIIELDLHGKTMTQQMIDTAATTGMPLIISCKQWAEHAGLPYLQASIRESEMPKNNTTGLMALSNGSRNFLRYGVGDLLRKDRNYKVIHRVWPGTQKVLLWGDPLFAAENGRMASFAGSDGIDYFEPLSFRGRAGSSLGNPPAPDRSGYADNSLRAAYDFDKYAYTFRLWGRLAYNPQASAETWQRQLKSDYGTFTEPLEHALATASRILPLVTTAHDPSAAGDSYWPENYTNQSLFDAAGSPYSEVPDPKVFGNVSPLDPQMFSTPFEYADALLAGKPSAKVSPVDVARQLEAWSNATATALAFEHGPIPPAVTRTQIDTTIVAGLGQFFAHKFRAAVLWQLFNRSGEEAARTAALDSYKKARAAWASLADTAKVYLPTQSFGGKNLRGHWADRLPAIDADIAGLAKVVAPPRTASFPPGTIDALIRNVLNPPVPPARKNPVSDHAPPKSFVAGQPLEIFAHFWDQPASITLWYRHLHQGERWQSMPFPAVVEMNSPGYRASIPAAYTNAPYPLQYYFEIRTKDAATLYPGFKDNFTGTPYFCVMPA